MPEHKQSSAPPVRKIGVREFRGKMSGVLRDVRAGASFQITSNDVVIAELRPPPLSTRLPRQPGGMEGEIWMADDFDTWPNDILATMEQSLEKDME